MCQQWGDCAFCTFSLKRDINSFAVVKYFHVILHNPDTQIKVIFATFPKMRTF